MRPSIFGGEIHDPTADRDNRRKPPAEPMVVGNGLRCPGCRNILSHHTPSRCPDCLQPLVVLSICREILKLEGGT